MDIYDFKNAFLIGVFMAFMIGPVFFMLIKTSVLKGTRAAISFDLGVIFGDICFMLIAYFGSRNLLEKIKDDPRLFLIGGLILIVYGIITYLSKKEIAVDKITISKENNYFKLFINGFLLNFINVGVLGFWLGLLIVLGPALDMNPTSIFWFLTVVVIGYFTTDIVKILLAKQLKNKLTPKLIYQINRVMGVLLIVFGLFLMLKNYIPKEYLPQDNFESFIKKK